MTPKTPSPSDGSDTPPRSRPNLGISAKDSAEIDLWAFDDEQAMTEMPVSNAPKKGIPEPRFQTVAQPLESPAELPQTPRHLPPPATPDAHDSIRVDVNPRNKPAFVSNPPRAPKGPVGRHTQAENFDDLDQWEESKTTAPATMPPSAFKEMPLATPSTPIPVPAPSIRPPAEAEDDRDEFSTHVRTPSGQPAVPLRPALNLNPIERIGLALCVLLLMAVGAVFYFSTIRQIPSGSKPVDPDDFPIQGEKVEAVSARSYWRSPVMTGPDADTVQRDTLLIPVVEFATRGGPATLRIFFRNERGDLVGDVMTRTVQGQEKLEITATAGFDDLAQHAAYRTSQTKPWTIEVLEAPPGTPAPTDFKRLFEMNIAIDLR